MFSPILAMQSRRFCSTLWPLAMLAASSASRSTGPTASAVSATAATNARKSSFLVTKSVSQLISTMAAAPVVCLIAIRPSAATRLAFLSALA